MKRQLYVRRAPKKRSAEVGSVTALIAGVILPMLFLSLGISVDLAKFYEEREFTQAALDSAAIESARFLPFKVQAEQMALSSVVRSNLKASKMQVIVKEDYVDLLYNASYELMFPKLAGYTLDLPYKVHSRSRIQPRDIVLSLDVSGYMAPPLPSGAPWGNSSRWPASYFFTTLNPLYSNGTLVNPRLLTQQCFSPGLYELKEAAVYAFDYLSSFRLNSVGAIVSPGSFQYPDTIKNVEAAGFRNGNGEASFIHYNSQFSGNEFCAAISDWGLLSEPYKLPQLSTSLNSPSVPPNGAPISLTTNGTWTYDSNYAPYLTTREVLWSQAVRRQYVADIGNTLQVIRTLLIQTGSRSDRGGLNGMARRLGVVLLGDVPRIGPLAYPDSAVKSALQAQLAQLDQEDIEVFIFILNHPGASGNLNNAYRDLESFASNINNLSVGLLNSGSELNKYLSILLNRDNLALVSQ